MRKLCEPMFHLEVDLHSRGPLCFRARVERLDADRQVVLPDIVPAPVPPPCDWLGSMDLTDGSRRGGHRRAGRLIVFLGAGCITGKCPRNDDYNRRVVVVAIPRDGKGRPRRSRCDGEGNFCVRYLTPGHYTLRALDPAIGWPGRRHPVGVGATDVGELRLKPGGTLAGTIAFRLPGPVPDEVVATDESGVATDEPLRGLFQLRRFEIHGLWPGRWTVAFRSGGARSRPAASPRGDRDGPRRPRDVGRNGP